MGEPLVAERVRERLAAAGIAVPRAFEVVIDLAGDPPLGQCARAIAVEDAPRVVRAIGAAMLASSASRGVIAVRDLAAERAVTSALAELVEGGGTVTVRCLPAVWPSTGIDRDVGCEGAWVLDGERALDVEAAAFARSREGRRVTVAGAVLRPGVVRAPPSVEQAVAACGGATSSGVVVIEEGPFGGRVADLEGPVSSSLLLVLPAAHPLVLRARTTLADWLRRAASACEGCRVCSDVCPVALDGGALRPHEVIATLVTARDDGTHLAFASACIACGVCDAACPSALSPRALVESVRDRLPPAVPAGRLAVHPDRAGRRMSIDLLLLRLGLAEVAQPI